MCNWDPNYYPYWTGEVLSKTDPRAWYGMAKDETHAAEILEGFVIAAAAFITEETPILWDFGESEPRVYWEKTAELVEVTQ